MAFRASGSLLDSPFSARFQNDWINTNLPELVGKTTTQYVAASALAFVVNSFSSSVTLVGFSKGGGQASFAASPADRVITFGAARNKDSNRGLSQNQTNVVVANDPVGVGWAGLGQLPGKTVSVHSGEPSIVPVLDIQTPVNIPFVEGGFATHSMNGIKLGLFEAARAANPIGGRGR